VRKIVVVTGAGSGIGRAAALMLAERGDEVVLLGRNERRLAETAERVKESTGHEAATIRADFTVLDEVRAAADRLRTSYNRIDVLVNNAGGLRGLTRVTGDGFETTMQVNHFAGFLLANLLHDRLGRVISTASMAEAWGWLDVDAPGRPGPRNVSRWLAYGAAKQANILFTIEAARRWPIHCTCFFPGLVRSRFASTSPLFMAGKAVMISPPRGAETLVWLTHTDEAVSGGYYFLKAPFAATSRATDETRAARLWRASEAAVGLA
jgi:NAD(P)-dependent dehydrogenase (short-subunit alcohol dehydrogenase family)